MKATARALLGLALCAGSGVGYFGWWARQPGFGEKLWPAWLGVLAGVAITAFAAIRPPAGVKRADRVLAALLLALAVGMGGLFRQFTAAATYRLPAADAARLADRRALPEITLQASDGAAFSLAAEQRAGRLAGRRIVLLFFRGFW